MCLGFDAGGKIDERCLLTLRKNHNCCGQSIRFTAAHFIDAIPDLCTFLQSTRLSKDNLRPILRQFPFLA